MNKTLAIILLVVLALILIMFIKALLPALTGFLKNLPKGIFILLFLVIVGLMAYLVIFIMNADVYGGSQMSGQEEVELPEDKEQQEEDETGEGASVPDHCILIREDRILIGDAEADMEAVGKYIDEHVVSNTPIVIVDDYSSAAVYHRITKLCDEKGVKYSKENEEWIKSQE